MYLTTRYISYESNKSSQHKNNSQVPAQEVGSEKYVTDYNAFYRKRLLETL